MAEGELKMAPTLRKKKDTCLLEQAEGEHIHSTHRRKGKQSGGGGRWCPLAKVRHRESIKVVTTSQ